MNVFIISDLLSKYSSCRAPIHLTCRHLYSRSLEKNLTQMFFSYSPLPCASTSFLKSSYPRIDSKIPHVSLPEVCVLAKNFSYDGLNDVCVIGKKCGVVKYLLSMLSVGITFQSLEVFPISSFKTKHKKQYIDLGYGKIIELNTTNIVCMDGEYIRCRRTKEYQKQR